MLRLNVRLNLKVVESETCLVYLMLDFEQGSFDS
jgi:hypothetical protein